MWQIHYLVTCTMTHFFYVGLYHGNFYPLTKSPHIDQLLSQEHLHQLIHETQPCRILRS